MTPDESTQEKDGHIRDRSLCNRSRIGSGSHLRNGCTSNVVQINRFMNSSIYESAATASLRHRPGS